MAQRVLKKLEVLKQYEKKRLRKYDMTECRNLGTVQLNPYVRTPLTSDFKMDYETSRSEKSAISASLFNQHVIQHSQSTVQSRQRSESTQTMRKNYSGKPAVRPFSAPACLKHKPTYQRGNLQALDGCFMILKLQPKLKPARSTEEVQKRRVSEEHMIAETGGQDQQLMVTVGKGYLLSANESTISNVERNQSSQELGSESEVKLLPNSNLSPDLSLLKDSLTTEGGRTEKDFIYPKDTLQKKKKPIVPLCIEDEIEKPNAKIIRAGCPRPKCESPMKMSESFPVFTRNDAYMDNYILNRWLALYGNKALDYMDQGTDACKYLNPVLQNNYNESISIIGSKEPSPPPPKVTVKRKKKPMLSGKPKRITLQILSVENAPSNIYVRSKKERPFVQKTNVSVAKTININTIIERRLTQSMLMGSKDTLMIQGVNLKGTDHPSILSRNLISGVKPKVPLHSVEDVRRKGRMIFVDYIPISKPIPVQRSGGKLSAPYSSTKVKPSETNKSLVCHHDEFDQESYQDENQPADMEATALHSRSFIQKGSDGSRRLVASASLKVFSDETSNRSQNTGIMATQSELLHIVPTRSDIISIPTAQFDAAESNKDQRMQDFNDTLQK
ncbi:uncharacterized protein C1orf141 homolog isoform X2 [Anolis carolinensis]|uniref:uncharacterized protein C1orf141 homolog isoform X2 n=1 Tax=Anolis carolinensis TaxID=28377 RepID=UPI002F2B18A0